MFFLIPSTWSSGLADKDSTSVNLRDADIIISDPSSVSRRSYPRTRSYAGCGHRGIHIQLRTDVLFNSRHPLVQGKPGKYQYILTNVHCSLFIITTDDHEMLIFAQSSVKLQLHFVLYFNIKKKSVFADWATNWILWYFQSNYSRYISDSKLVILHYIAEKYLVHEFAKYWYGVFEEYPNPGENQFYFSTTVGRADPVRCTTGLRGRIMKKTQSGIQLCSYDSIDPDTGEFPEGCVYYPYPSHNQGTASMMDHSYIQEVIPLHAGLTQIIFATICVDITNNNSFLRACITCYINLFYVWITCNRSVTFCRVLLQSYTDIFWLPYNCRIAYFWLPTCNLSIICYITCNLRVSVMGYL